jgi:hypothetical protein
MILEVIFVVYLLIVLAMLATILPLVKGLPAKNKLIALFIAMGWPYLLADAYFMLASPHIKSYIVGRWKHYC